MVKDCPVFREDVNTLVLYMNVFNFRFLSLWNSSKYTLLWQTCLFYCILLIMLLQLSQFFPLCLLHPAPPTPSSNFPHPLFTSMGHPYKFFGNSFPLLFLTSSCLFCTYQFLLVNPFTFSPISPNPHPN